jgi:hypothetical protein
LSSRSRSRHQHKLAYLISPTGTWRRMRGGSKALGTRTRDEKLKLFATRKWSNAYSQAYYHAALTSSAFLGEDENKLRARKLRSRVCVPQYWEEGVLKSQFRMAAGVVGFNGYSCDRSHRSYLHLPNSNHRWPFQSTIHRRSQPIAANAAHVCPRCYPSKEPLRVTLPHHEAWMLAASTLRCSHSKQAPLEGSLSVAR